MWQGSPLLYDAIEFDDAMATIDTLYDLAFLLWISVGMATARRQYRAQSLSSGAAATRAISKGLAALPLFLRLRAAIRAMVTIDRANQEDAEAARGDLDREARISRRRSGISRGQPRS